MCVCWSPSILREPRRHSSLGVGRNGGALINLLSKQHNKRKFGGASKRMSAKLCVRVSVGGRNNSMRGMNKRHKTK